jgi:RNA polymerase sigma factor (sigma-70 family)
MRRCILFGIHKPYNKHTHIHIPPDKVEYLFGLMCGEDVRLGWLPEPSYVVLLRLLVHYDGSNPSSYVEVSPAAFDGLTQGLARGFSQNGEDRVLFEEGPDGRQRLKQPVAVYIDPTLAEAPVREKVPADLTPHLNVLPSDSRDYLNWVVSWMTRHGCTKFEIGKVVLSHPYFQQLLEQVARSIMRCRPSFNESWALINGAWYRCAEYFQVSEAPWNFDPSGSFTGYFQTMIRRYMWRVVAEDTTRFPIEPFDLENITDPVGLPDDDTLDDLLNNLREPQREVAMRHFCGGQTVREIAKALQKAPGTVAGLLKRATERLRQLLRSP